MQDDLENANKEIGIKEALITPDVKEAYLSNADEEALIREVGFAVQILQDSEYLRKCTPASIRKSVKNVALTGITLNPAQGLAYLIPRNINKVQTCCLDFSYKGLCHVAVQSGAVYDIAAYVRYAKDEFHIEQGTNAEIRHTPSLEQDRGAATHVYAVATLHHNVKKFEVMTMKEVEEIRKISKQPNGLMWRDFHGEGCRKTVIKRLCKYLPQKGALAQAIALNNEVDGVEIEVGYITEAQVEELKAMVEKTGAAQEALLNYLKVESLDKIWTRDFKKAIAALKSMEGRAT